MVENDDPAAAPVLRTTYTRAGKARTIGITGPPGSGKSTLVAALVAAYRRAGERVAVVAVDPSSPFTGGAILGDRIRLRDQFLDEGLFIRSMATRGQTGGLARATGRMAAVLDAVGYGVVLVETVGVGQEEVDVVRLVDTVCLVTVPGLGDDIQAIKAGIIEIADVLVVNKSDRPGADEAARDLRYMLSLGASRTGWTPPIVRTTATTGEGVERLVKEIDAHRTWSRESGEHDRRRLGAARSEVETLLRDELVRRLGDRRGAALDALVAKVASRETDPYSAVEQLLGVSDRSG